MFILIFYHILYPLREPRFPEPLLCSRKSGKDGFFSCFAKRFPKSEFCSTFSKSGFPKVDFTVAMLFAPPFPKSGFCPTFPKSGFCPTFRFGSTFSKGGFSKGGFSIPAYVS